MRILWLCNTLMEDIANKIGMIFLKPESWIESYFVNLKHQMDFELIYLYPAKQMGDTYNIKGDIYIAYDDSISQSNKQVEYFKSIIKKYTPDIIQIFGTELYHTYDMVKACDDFNIINKVVISIQGIISECYKSFNAGLPEYMLARKTFRDFVKNDSLKNMKQDFYKRGQSEIRTLGLVNNVIGRTEWDKTCVKKINPDIVYLHSSKAGALGRIAMLFNRKVKIIFMRSKAKNLASKI